MKALHQVKQVCLFKEIVLFPIATQFYILALFTVDFNTSTIGTTNNPAVLAFFGLVEYY